eukprot:GFUD01045532.1.p1 GENE.GFUD01045532.1~~GFUD01045532.1.p1  ORF type:complete len:234 (+),score=64.32 GFUD01045532.1:39-740(+)
MNSLRHLVQTSQHVKFPISLLKTSFTPMLSFSQTSPFLESRRQLSISMALLGDRDRRAENSTRKLVRGKDFDQSVNDVINLDTLARVEEEEVVEGEQHFTLFPDETTPGMMFNGVAFKDLPYVTMVLHRNNTKLISRYADQKYIWHNSPSTHGFINAKKRTNVAGQVAGLNMGQKLRGLGIKTVRLRINGFNAARVSTIKGITQAGIEIVAIADVTTVNWDWPQRAKGRPSKN